MEEWGPQLVDFSCYCRERWGLRRRESEVLYFLCCGFTEGKQLARLLCVAMNTLINHLYSLYEALGVGCKTQAVLAAWTAFDFITRGGNHGNTHGRYIGRTRAA